MLTVCFDIPWGKFHFTVTLNVSGTIVQYVNYCFINSSSARKMTSFGRGAPRSPPWSRGP